MGLDLSTTASGVVVIDRKKSPEWNTVANTPWAYHEVIRDKGALTDPWRVYKHMVDSVLEICDTFNPTVVGIESPMVVDRTSPLLSGLYWQIVRELHYRKKLVVAIHNQQLAALMLQNRHSPNKSKKDVIVKWKSEQSWYTGGTVSADAVEAYYAAYYTARFITTVETYRSICNISADTFPNVQESEWHLMRLKALQPHLHPKELEIFLTRKLNSKKTSARGMLWRPSYSFFDFTDSKRTGTWPTFSVQ